jgi:hypothetical protein
MTRQGVNRNKNYDYGKCHVCGEQVKEKRINPCRDPVRTKTRIPKLRGRH